MRSGRRSLALVTRLLCSLLAWPGVTAAQALPPVPVATPTVPTPGPSPPAGHLGGDTLDRVDVAGWPVYFDHTVYPPTRPIVAQAFERSLEAIPRLSGLPATTTPLAVYVLADDDRFREALTEMAGIDTDLVADEIRGFAAVRNGTMLLFFAAPNLAVPSSATLAIAHELTHLAVREASAVHPVPAWFNEGYASWLSIQVTAEAFPAEAKLQHEIDELAVVSALRGHGLIPWSDLGSGARFAQATVDGQASLAFGQSTLFVDWLARQHSPGALARFLTALGEGQAPAVAFASSFGSFVRATAALDAYFTDLAATRPPGLYLLARTADGGVVLGVPGGEPNGTGTVTVLDAAGEAIAERSLDVDGAGLLVASVSGALLPDGGRVRVAVPPLPLLELNPAVESSVLATPTTGPRPAPVQVPTP